MVQGTFYTPKYWKGISENDKTSRNWPRASFTSWYSPRDDDNELLGYAYASIRLYDFNLVWCSQDMRLSRAAALSEMLTGRILNRGYYHLSDDALLTRLLSHPRAEAEWHADVRKEEFCPVCGSEKYYHFISKTPYGEAHLILDFGKGYDVFFNGQRREKITHREASRFILDETKKLHQAAIAKKETAAA
jgi:hypothetical protein